MIAAQKKNDRWFNELLDKGAGVLQCDSAGWTVLHHAVAKNNATAAQRTIDHAGKMGLDVAAFVDCESKHQETAYELAWKALKAAEEHYEDAKWDAEGDEVKLASRRRQMDKAQELCDALLSNGASDISARRNRRCRRIACYSVRLPVALLQTVVACLALLCVSPSLNEIPIALAHASSDHRAAYNAAAAVVAFVICFAAVLPVFQSNVATSFFLSIVVCVQVAVVNRVFKEPRYERRERNERTTTPIFAYGADRRSVLLLLVIIMQGLQQSALAFVSPISWQGGMDIVLQACLLSTDAARALIDECVDVDTCAMVLAPSGNMTCEEEFCPSCRNAHLCDAMCGLCDDSLVLTNWFEYTFAAIATFVVATFVVMATVALSLAVVRKPSLRDQLPPLRADSGYRLPNEPLLTAYLNQGLWLPVIFNLLRTVGCIPAQEGSGSLGPNDTTEQWLQAQPTRGCWVGSHAWMASFAMVLLWLYVCICAVFARFLCEPRVKYGTVGLHFCERFDAVAQLVKLVMAAAAVFFVQHAHVTTALMCIGNGALVLLSSKLYPAFTHEWLARCTVAVYAAAFAASLVALGTVLLCGEQNSCGRWPEVALIVCW